MKTLTTFFLILGLVGCANSSNNVRNPSSSDVVRIFAAGSMEGVRITAVGSGSLFEYCTGMAFGAGNCEELGTVSRANLSIFKSRFHDQLENIDSGDGFRALACGVTFGLSLLVTKSPFSDDRDRGSYKQVESCSINAVTRTESGDVVTKISGKALRNFYYGIFKE